SNLLTLNQEEIRGCLVGEVRPTLDDIYELYCQHATIVGFSVRKAKNRKKEGTQIIKEKYYFCSAQGQRNTRKKKEENELMIEKSTSTKMNKNGEFEIVHHVMQHNHPLTREPLNYLHRSERQMN
ncbi:Protein FAR1-RELATED SEQUENCE 11, partial [Bienertia sinuspersici]